MRRRSERKKSVEVAPSPGVLKRQGRRSQRCLSQSENQRVSKTDKDKDKVIDEIDQTESNEEGATLRKSNDSELEHQRSCSPQNEDQTSPVSKPKLDAIVENSTAEKSNEDVEDKLKDTKSTRAPKEATPSRDTPGRNTPSRDTPKKETNQNEQSDEDGLVKDNNIEENSKHESVEKGNNNSYEENTNIENKNQTSKDEGSSKQTINGIGDTNAHVKQASVYRNKSISPDRSEKQFVVENKRNSISNKKEHTSQCNSSLKEETENDENDEYHNKSKKKSFYSSVSNEKTQNTRKRRWLSKRSSNSNSQILAISTDSLKNLISDVHPVPLCDVKLESSSEIEEIDSEKDDKETSPIPNNLQEKSEKRSSFEKDHKLSRNYEQTTRTVSVLNDDYDVQPIPPKKSSSCILYITNLVRPFTILQLKGLLARTGKIVENRFWIDKIKSKCYVQYETEDEAVETRHALHGVRWPISNPKCLKVDFGTVNDMEKALAFTQESSTQFGHETDRENRIIGTGWDRDRFEFEEKKINRPIREWDVGKKQELENEEKKDREKSHTAKRGDGAVYGVRTDKQITRNKEPDERDREKKRWSSEYDHRGSLSESPARKIKKRNNDPPLRLLDDLFRKTKTTPCIYWLPLTPEQIAEKETFRLKRVAEHQERVRQRELEKEKAREREREREKERRRDTNRSVGHRRSVSRDRRRY